MFLVCQKEESVRRAFEAVLKQAESDKKFARLVAEKSERVLRSKKKSRAAIGPRRSYTASEDADRLSAAQDWQISAKKLRCVSGRSAEAPGDRRRRDERNLGRRHRCGLVRIQGRGFRSRLELLAHYEFPYPAEVRHAVLAAMNAARQRGRSVAAEFSAGRTLRQCGAGGAAARRLECELVGCHGQTIYHQGTPKPYLGRRIACTWQTGEGAVIAAQLGVPVVSDFRPADMAAGGKGAPLVPFLDYMLYRHRRYGRIVQNLGGIGNLTAIPPRPQPDQVIAFDTGPGNMVIDAVTERAFRSPFDRNGRLAAKGDPIERVMVETLRQPFFRQRPPKTAGREQFGREFVRAISALCRRADPHDVIATATALTARSIGMAVRDLYCRCSTTSPSADGRRGFANSSSPAAERRTPP